MSVPFAKWPEDIREKYPVYEIETLENSIAQVSANIKLMSATLEKETAKLKQLREYLQLCYERDEELRNRGII